MPEDNDDYISEKKPVLRFGVGDLIWCHGHRGSCVPAEITDVWWHDPSVNAEVCYRAKLPDGSFMPILSDGIDMISSRMKNNNRRFDSVLFGLF